MKSIIFIRIDQRGDYKFSNQLSHFSEKEPEISCPSASQTHKLECV